MKPPSQRVAGLLADDKLNIEVIKPYSLLYFFYRTLFNCRARSTDTATPAEHYAPHARASLHAAAQALVRFQMGRRQISRRLADCEEGFRRCAHPQTTGGSPF